MENTIYKGVFRLGSINPFLSPTTSLWYMYGLTWCIA